ncbi:peptidase family C50-domain-containing protein [Tuber brumale]|nr:peptidase family C50-domain-containing protein [Tuber brumale]
MSSKIAATSNPYDEIKQSLGAETCPASTVELLNEVLFAPASSMVAATVKVSTKAKHSLTNSRSQKPVVAVERASAAVTLASKIADRYKLAIEVINTSLRNLSEAVKKDPKAAVLEVHEKDQPVRKTEKQQQTSVARPLHSRSSNRNNAPAPLRPDTTENLATCCSLAISYLNSISGSSNAPDIAPLQIENAQSSLILKLIQLGMFELGLEESRSLKRTLVEAMGSGGGSEKQDRPTPAVALVEKEDLRRNVPKAQKEPIDKLLKFNDVAISSPAFPLVISCQLGILRCIAGLKRPELVEAVLPTLSSSTVHNPLNVIRALAGISLQKALAHLNVLHYTLVSMAPSISTSADAVATNAKLSCSPRAALALQTKALQCSIVKVTLQPNFTEIADKERDDHWESWRRYTLAFVRRTQDYSSKRERYGIVQDLADAVRRFLRVEGASHSYPPEVTRILSSLSFEAGLMTQSMELTRAWVQELEKSDVQSDAALGLVGRVRMATAELKISMVIGDGELLVDGSGVRRIKDRVGTAVEGLEKISKGRKSDLDQLLVEAGYLRRSGVSLLVALLKDESQRFVELKESEARAVRLELRDVCNMITRGVVGFCRKYLAMGSQGDERTRAIKLAVSAIDTSVSTAWRGFDIESCSQWEELEELMRDSLALVRSLTESDLETLGDVTLYEKFSSTYWQIHLLYRKAGMDKESVRALKRSISVLDGRPPVQLAKANIALKWERLGSSFMSMGDWRKAEETLLKAMGVFIETGIIGELGICASQGGRVGSEFEAHTQEAMVGRVLASLIKCASRRKSTEVAVLRFDDEKIAVAARGMLLEWSLKLAIGVMANDGVVVRVLAERLLEVYPLEAMPLRRARVVSRILGLAVDHPEIFNIEEVKVIGDEVAAWSRETPIPSLAEDRNLAKYKEDIITGCLVSLAFLKWINGEAGVESVKEAVGAWGILVKGCSTWDMLLEKVEEISIIMKTLDMLAEFSEMRGEADLKLCVLKVLVSLREIEKQADYDALVRLETLIGLHYLRLGYSGRSGMTMAKAQALMKKDQANVSTVTILQWHMAYTEYLVNIGNLEKAEEYLEAASNILEGDQDLNYARMSGARIAKRVKLNRIIADAAYVMSLLTFEKGNPSDALAHARRCVRLNQRAWAGLESLSRDSLVDSMATLSTSDYPQPKVQSTTFGALNVPLLWPLVSSLYAGLLQTSNIYRHQGMVREAEFYLEQALKTVEAVSASSRINLAMTMYGDLRIRSGHIDEGEEMLQKAGKSIGKGREVLEFEVASGNLDRLRGDFAGEGRAYERAEKQLEQLMSVRYIEKLGAFTGDSEDLAEKVAILELREEPQPKPEPKRRGRPPAAKPKTTKVSKVSKASKVTKASEAVPAVSGAVAAECSVLLKQKGNLLRLKAHNLTMQRQCEQAEVLLQEASKLPVGHQETVIHGLTEAKHLLQEALSLVGSDPVFSVLHESTISLPSVAPRAGESSPVKKSTRKGVAAAAKQTKKFVEILTRARDAVANVHTRAVKTGSSTITHSVASLLSQIIVLLSAVTNSKGKGPEHPLFASYSLELHKGISLQREKAAIETEKVVSRIPEDLSWPRAGSVPDAPKSLLAGSTPFEFSNFQSDYVDIIPKKWAAVSVSLSESREELYLSRFQAGQSQLMVRLPLTRHNSRDDYEDRWEYESVLEELNEIVKGANISAHNAKDMTSKGARSEWWKQRESLDTQLKDLLSVIEYHWLGGFKGVFCQYALHKEYMAKFKSTFDKILAKHLPSRQNKRAKRVNIDYRILELFIGLGRPDEQDLDEALVDLIYFVVDILQFHGEGNAYDEVDFDVMVLEFTEALAAYHKGVSFHPNEVASDVDHTILILDKSVHMFPWESLPCLRGHSVSRLPSLASLRDRILMMQEKGPSQQSRPGFYADKTCGAYILNPGSDLVNTQKAFEEDLRTLKTWEGIVGRPPSEEEFRRNLEERDLLLYFGHGSGAHFIRARTLKKLDKCGIALLLGCSSGALKDTGEFEPYGMPVNYLLGGCPSMVATLWDVTDKDIDRFSKDVFNRWGLFSGPGKSKKEREVEAPHASLVEAVAKGRESCVLKYLNGAAPVVYGIPAYLS